MWKPVLDEDRSNARSDRTTFFDSAKEVKSQCSFLANGVSFKRSCSWTRSHTDVCRHRLLMWSRAATSWRVGRTQVPSSPHASLYVPQRTSILSRHVDRRHWNKAQDQVRN